MHRYTELLASSRFALVPRGDNLYSYRFFEVLAAGTTEYPWVPWVLLGTPEYPRVPLSTTAYLSTPE